MGWHRITRTTTITATALLLSLGAVTGIAYAQGVKLLSVQSNSMVPSFSKGDLVAVTSVPDKQYAAGDVITFTNPNNARETISHRVKEVVPKGAELRNKTVHQTTYITKGDANNLADVPVKAQNVLGKVSFDVPFVGYAFDFARQPIGLLLLIYVPAITIVAAELRRLNAHYRSLLPYTATVYQPDESEEQPRLAQQLRKPAVATATIVAVASAGLVAVPMAHAALLDKVDLQDSSATTMIVPPVGLDYPVISKVAFGTTGNTSSGNTNNTTIQITNNNPQTATSGNATASGGGNATSGNATNTSNTSFNFNVTTTTGNSTGGGSQSSSPTTISIYNPTNAPIDVSDWKLSNSATTLPLPAGSIIASKNSLTFTWPAANPFSKSSDRLIFGDKAGAIKDTISWGTDNSQLNPPVDTTASSTSLQRVDPNVDTNAKSDWTVL